MKYSLLACLAVLLTAGCSYTPYTWQHPDRLGEQALNQAEKNCALLADDELYRYGYAGPYPYFGSTYRGPMRYDYFHRYPFFGDYPGDPFYGEPYAATQGQLFRVCMKAKGWQLVPATKADSAG